MYPRTGEKRSLEDINLEDEEAIGSLCKLSNSGGAMTPTVLDPEKQLRRIIANQNERRRMESINAGFASLKNLLPHNEGEKLSKAAILQQTTEYIYQLEQEKTRLLTQNCTLKRLLNQQQSDTEGSAPGSDSPDDRSINTPVIISPSGTPVPAAVAHAPDSLFTNTGEEPRRAEPKFSDAPREKRFKSTHVKAMTHRIIPYSATTQDAVHSTISVHNNVKIDQQKLNKNENLMSSVPKSTVHKYITNPVTTTTFAHSTDAIACNNSVIPTTETNKLFAAIRQENSRKPIVKTSSSAMMAKTLTPIPVLCQSNKDSQVKTVNEKIFSPPTFFTVVPTSNKASVQRIAPVIDLRGYDLSGSRRLEIGENIRTNAIVQNSNIVPEQGHHRTVYIVNPTTERSLDLVIKAVTHIEGADVFGSYESKSTQIKEEIITSLAEPTFLESNIMSAAEAQSRVTYTAPRIVSTMEPADLVNKPLRLMTLPSEPQDAPLELTTPRVTSDFVPECNNFEEIVCSTAPNSIVHSRPGVIVVKNQ